MKLTSKEETEILAKRIEKIVKKVEKLENYLSIDFDINYSIFENTKFTLNLNNILDSKNEIYYKYQDLGFNLKLGFIYSLK